MDGLPWLCGEGLVNVWHDSSSSDGRPYEQIEFFVSPDGELQVAWCYAFDSEISGGVA